MIRIAMCDDDINDIKKAQIVLSEFFNHTYPEIPIKISKFESGEALASSIAQYIDYDIFILDVDLGTNSKNGLFYANKIHRFNPSAIIIYLSAYSDFAIDGYKSGAIRYVYKPRIDKAFPEALDTAVKEVLNTESLFCILNEKKGVWKILLSDIKYVKKENRVLNIATRTQGLLKSTQSLHQFFESLNDSRFVFIDKGTFINLEFVENIVNDKVKILGENLPFYLSRRCKPSVRKALVSFLMSQEL